MAIGKLPDADLEGAEESIFSEINVTPLTDIFLVLLIIFMVGSTMAVEKLKEDAKDEKSSGLKVDLPKGAAKEIDPGRASVVVGLTKNGQLLVNGQPIADPDLDTIFQSAFTSNKDTQIVIRADAGVIHGRVVGVMERAKRVGLRRIAIATQGG
ncbi:MAG TPA: biopolymer transporter ExbD [Kofleriaceae bacterium]|nr:biopolymer transporter ExbD [Kofleriaceae bacterium]